MKYLLIIFLFISCQKDTPQPVRGSEISQEIYGSYNAGISSGSGQWQQTLNIIPKDDNEVYLIFSGNMFGDSLSAEITDDIIIHLQSFYTSLNIPYTITGSGDFINPELNLTIGKSIESIIINYNIVAIHQ